ncbi:uncharacterized protein LOC143920842 [Arctopsyche grandis]|uniref:uncharacterized protein LOC143920842 n=1 Tax=Arctopsyche grandis TaxID=121162 RepID=UPI00406D93EC
MEYKFLPIIVGALFLQCGVHCFYASMSIPFFGIRGSLTTQDTSISQSISRLIASSRSTSANYRNQATNIAREIENVSNRFSLSIGTNITNTIINIHKPCLELIERALNQSGTVAECAQEQSDEIASVINATIADFLECKLEKIEEGLAIVQELHSNCENATIIAQNAIRGLGNCLRLASGNIFGIVSPAVLSCKFRLAADAGRNFTTLGIDIARSMNDARVYLQNLKLDLITCGIIATAKAAESAGVIASELASCFDNSTTSG